MLDIAAAMDRAIALGARAVAEGLGGPFGAVILGPDGDVVAEGHNEVLASGDPTAHAEMVTIRRATAASGRFDLTGHVLVSSCDPCPMCLGAALWSRVTQLHVAATAEDAAEIGFDDAAFHAAVARGDDRDLLPPQRIGRDAARAMMTGWTDRPELARY